MGQQLLQLQNSEISITSNNLNYIDNIDNFKKDYPTAPDFKNNFVLYNRTLKQYVIDNTMQEYTAQPNLDKIIDNLTDIVSAQQKRTLPQADPTKPPTTDEQIAALDDEYQPQFDNIATSYTLATMQDDSDAQKSVKSDLDTLQTEYKQKIGEITNANS